MNELLESLIKRYMELNKIIQNPELAKKDIEKFRKLIKEYSQLGEIVAVDAEKKDLLEQREIFEFLWKAKEDQKVKDSFQRELRKVEINIKDVEDRLKFLLAPFLPPDDKNVVMEIYAEEGDRESELFAEDLFRMYSLYAETKNWKIEKISSFPTKPGVFSKIVFSISGRGVYKNLRHESGVHRFQRVPDDKASGRIYTSTAKVIVHPPMDGSKIDIITHIYLSKATAINNQVDSESEFEWIRTYNFPQNRVTDHRINLTLYKLDLIMQGEAEELFRALAENDE